jgi:hypothetical protein
MVEKQKGSGNVLEWSKFTKRNYLLKDEKTLTKFLQLREL